MTCLLLVVLLNLQTPEPKEVEAAVQRGLTFLRAARVERTDFHSATSDVQPLRMLTFARAGEPTAAPAFQKAIEDNLKIQLASTYDAALLAMAWEEVDRVKYQKEIARCAQYLLDAQNEDGSWSYGGRELRDPVAFVETPAPVPTGDPKIAPDGKPRVQKRIELKPRRQLKLNGDNSNSQFAAMGLRAAHDAGIGIPEDVARRGAQAWRDRLFADAPGAPPPPVVTGKSAPPTGRIVGWGYTFKLKKEDTPYEAMTAGGIAALTIYDHLLKKDWRKDADLDAALRWMALHFSGNAPRVMPLYSLYAVERAGVLYGTETFGTLAWYPEGARQILALQRPDGSWSRHPPRWSSPDCDTCFAILFLKRATRRLDVDTPARETPAK